LSEEEQKRDRDLENILGQFLVASFQTDKLAEMIYEKLPFGGAREARFVLPQRGLTSRSLLVTIRVEPSPARALRVEEEEEAGNLKALCVLESPSLDVESSALRQHTREMLEGSLQWWIRDGNFRNLRLDDWRVNVSVIEGKDARKLSSMYTLLGNLEAKRKGDISR
jgi:hypothetical protein